MVKHDNKIKWNPVKNTENVHLTKHIHSLLTNNKKLNDTENMANDFNNLFTAVMAKLNLHQVGKDEATSSLKETFPGKTHGHKIIPTTQTEIKHI
jgi:hypothetical protein